MSGGVIRNRYVALDVLTVGIHQRLRRNVGGLVADSVALELNGMTAKLTAKVLAEQLPPEHVERAETVSFSYPDGWWQMFRDTYRSRWWMRWSLARWPVRTRTYQQTVRFTLDLRRYWLYPHANVPLPNLGDPVRGSTVFVAAEPQGWQRHARLDTRPAPTNEEH